MNKTLTISLALMALAAPVAHAADPGAGLHWLDANRAAEGSFGDPPLRATSVAAEAFAAVGVPLDAASPEALYLSAARPEGIDAAAWRLAGLEAVGDGDLDGAAALLAAQNVDGGWGPLPGWASSVPETAHALTALTLSGIAPASQLQAAASWLAARRDVDGGWGYEGNGPSITLTAEVIHALTAVGAQSTAVAEARAWLVAAQEQDGAFGAGAEQALLTAQALWALAEDPTAGEAFSLGADALDALQLADGSWESDAFTTAAAVRALGFDRPNLKVTGLTVSGAGGAAPVEGEPATVTLTITNAGRRSSGIATSAAVRLYLGSGAAPAAIGAGVVPILGPGASTQVTVPWDTTGRAGSLYVMAEVDPSDLVSETSEGDNELVATTYLIPRVDLEVTPADLSLSPDFPGVGEEVTITAVVRNRGGTDAADLAVAFYDGDPAAGGALLSQEILPSVPAFTSARVTYTSGYDEGSHPIYVAVDPADAIEESLEGNNVASITVEVRERIDFAGSYERIWVSSSDVVEPEVVTVQAVILNLREDGATDVPVRCSVYNTTLHTDEDQRVPVGPDVVIPSLPGGGSATVRFSFNTRGYVGKNYLFVEADPDDAFVEVREDNNRAIAAVNVTEQANVYVDTIYVSPTSPVEGQTVRFYARIGNDGGVEELQVPIRFQLGDPGPSGIPILPTVTSTQLKVGEVENTAYVYWDSALTPGGDVTVYAIIDPDGRIDEVNEADNIKGLTFTLKARTNLIVQDLTLSDPAPEDGDLVTATIQVANTAPTATTATFAVRLYDGDPAGGGAPIGDPVPVAGLGANATTTVQIPWSTLREAGEHTLVAWVDPEGVVDERFTEDNTASTRVTVSAPTRPELRIEASELSASARRGVSPGDTITFTLPVHEDRDLPAEGVRAHVEASTIPLASAAGLAIPALSSTDAVLSWTTPVTLLDTTLTFKADPLDAFAEADETDNAFDLPYKSRLAAGTEPTDLAAQLTYHTVDLSWSASPEPQVVGYWVWRGDERANPDAAQAAAAVVASSESNTTSRGKQNAVDGDPVTYWRSDSSGAPHSFEIQLAEPRTATRLDVWWDLAYRGVAYELQGWDGAAWQTLMSTTGNAVEQVSHPATRYLTSDRFRVYVTQGATTAVGIKEVSVVGFDPALELAFTDVDVPAGSWDYTVTAVAASTFESPDSNVAEVQVAEVAAPGALTATPDYTRVDLSWTPVTDGGLVSYLVYRDGALVHDRLPASGGSLTSAGDYSTSYPVSYAGDGDEGSWWRSPTAQPWQLTRTFSETTLVTGVDLLFNGSYRAYDYVIDAWDGDAWIRLQTVTGNTTSRVSYRWEDPFPTDRLRVTFTRSTSTTVGVYELGVETLKKVTTSSYADTHLNSGGYAFEVAGINRLGEIGAASTASAEVPIPLPPASVTVTPGVNTAAVAWPEVQSAALASYLVDRDGIPVDTVTQRQRISGATASASDTYSSSYLPSYANNGGSGYWRNLTNTFPTWWKLTFPSAQVLTAVELDWQNSYVATDFKVQVYDGKYWRTVDEVHGNTSGYTRHPFATPFATTAFRVLIDGSTSTTVGLEEAYALGYAARTTAGLTETSVPSGVREYSVRVLDLVGELSEARASSATLPLPAPSGLSAVVDGDNVALSWTAATGAGVVGYRVTRDGLPLGGYDSATNLALSASLSASSQSSTSYAATAAADNNTSTFWSGADNQPSWWIRADFPRPIELSGVQCLWYSAERGVDYQIQALVDGEWVTQRTVVGNTFNTFSHGFDRPVSTTALRILVTKASGTAPGLYEMRIYPRRAYTGTAYNDRNVDAGSHLYGVESLDALGGVSARVTTTAVLEEVLPPTLTRAEAVGSDVELAWSASPTAGVTGYRIYRDDRLLGSQVSLRAETTATSNSLYSGSTTYQAQNAVDGNPNTRYRSGGTIGDKILTFTWPSPHKVSQLSLDFGTTYYPTAFQVEVWDGARWYVEDARAGSGFSSVIMVFNNTLTTTQMRVVFTAAANTYVEVYEADILEHLPEADLSYTDPLVYDGRYGYCVKAVTPSYVSPCSAPRVVELSDVAAPPAPQGVVISDHTATNITVAWDAPLDADVYGHYVYYDGAASPLNTTPVTGTSYRHTSIISRDILTYTYEVQAVDVNGNVGPRSAPVAFAPDPLDAPTGLSGVAEGQSVNLSWDAHADPLASSYTVYLDGALVSDYVTATATTLTPVPRGDHAFTVATRDLFGRLGAPGEGVTVTLSDLDLRAETTSLFFQPQSPSELDDLHLKASFRNAGDSTTPATSVDFYDGDPAAGGAFLGRGALAPLGADQLGVAEITWALTGQAGAHTIYAVVDPDDDILEFYEGNNVATAPLNVTEVPELVVEVGAIDASNFPEIKATVGVVTPQGQPVAGLRPQNFLVLEDDLAQGPLTVVETSQLTEVEPLLVDRVVLVDSSGSMDVEWVRIPEIVDDLGDALYVRGIDAQITKLSLAASVSGYTPLSTGTFDGVDYPLSCGVPCQEDWAPGTAYLAKSFAWREGAVRVIIPAADEDAYHGDPESAEDLRSVDEAGGLCQEHGVLAFPLWGEGSAQTVIDQMHDLADLTGAEAFYYEDADLIVPYMVDAIEAQFAQYEVTYLTLDDLPDGSERLVDITARYRGAEGSDSGTYVAPGQSRLDLVAEDLRLDPPAPLAGSVATLTASVLSRSTVGVDGAVAALFMEDGRGQRIALGEVSLGSLSPGQRAEVSAPWDVAPGPWILAVEVDPGDVVEEEDEGNNRAELAVDVPGAPAYELIIPEGGVTVSPLHPLAGDHAEVSALVRNLGQPVKGALVALYLGDGAASDPAAPPVILPPLGRGEEVIVTFSWDTEGLLGEVQLTALADAALAFAEVNEDNNRRTLDVTVVESPYEVSVVADAASYAAGEGATFTATVINRDAAPFTGEVVFSLVDAAGEEVAELGRRPVADLAGASGDPTTRDVPLPWDVGATLAGDYAVRATLTQGDDVRAEDDDAFAVTALYTLAAEVATDWDAYDPWERVFVDAQLTNTSVNGIAAPTDGTLTLYDPHGEAVDSESYGVLALAPGGELSFTVDFPLTEAEPGTWAVELVGAIDGEAAAVARATFEIRGTGGDARSLFGALAITPNQALVGEALSAAWSVENRGNEAVVGLPVGLTIADAETGEVAWEAALDTVSLATSAQASGSGAVDTTALGVGAWLAYLTVTIDGEDVPVAVSRFSLVNLLGSLTVSPEEAEGGVDTLTLSWAVTNRSAGRLSDIPLAITVVSDADGVERARFDFTVDLDAQATSEGDEAQPSAALALGAHTARLVTVVDGGDLPIAEAPFTVVDTRAPSTVLSWVGELVEVEGARYAPSATRYLLQATDSFSGIEALRFTVDAGAEATYEGPIALVTEGSHTLGYFAIDGAGNRETPGAFGVTVDDSPPVIAVDVLDGGGCLEPGDALRFSVTDLCPFEASATLDGAAFTSGGAVSVGDHTLVVTATDALGHEASRTVTFATSDDACACASGDAIADADGDGIPTCGGDCDDADPLTFPGAVEVCDAPGSAGVDNDCDGQIDEDDDGDGYAACDDCDEGDADVNPGAVEVGNGVDDDCDGTVDEDLCLTDADGDGATTLGGDCDDANSGVRPGAPEVADGVDEDCDGRVDEGTVYYDDDGDLFTEAQGDCDDRDPAVHPGAAEAVNGVDDDCDGAVEDGAVDADGDGVSPSAGDCDDGDAQTSPRATEAENGADDDCDGRVDEGTAAFDDDGDGQTEAEGDCDDGDAGIGQGFPEREDGLDGDCDGQVDEGVRPCDLDGDGFSEAEGDCDDTDAAISPAGEEACSEGGDAQDEDCDGAVDEGGVCDEPTATPIPLTPTPTPLQDVDGDSDGYTAAQGDCDDGDPAVNPGSQERCDAGGSAPADDDCDGRIDEGLQTTTVWVDADGDGYGEGDQDALGVERCEGVTQGYAPIPGDCDDGDADINPGAGETCGNGVDDDCDGSVDAGACTEATPTGGEGDEGCGCHSAPADRSAPWTALLLGLAGLWIRRRSRAG